jgi:hypothetical protein
MVIWYFTGFGIMYQKNVATTFRSQSAPTFMAGLSETIDMNVGTL